MAYQLKYYSEEFTRGGDTIQLRIYEKDYTGSAKQIGDFAGMYLDIQGANDTVDAPVVKTSLRFSMADTVDKTSTSTVKYGGWTEFYTPDSTKYKVELRVNSAAIWTGYVTPDSWGENLKYRDYITVTARDNLGHLEDFEFKAQDIIDAGYDVTSDGLASVQSILRTAMSIVDFPMTFDYISALYGYELYAADGLSATLWQVDLEAFNTMTWWEAVTSLLSSIAMCLRYVGGNTFALSSVRGLPYMGQSSVPSPTPFLFLNRTGYRSLDPAYKQIVETFNFRAKKGHSYTWNVADFSGTPVKYNGANGWRAFSSLSTASPLLLDATSLAAINGYGDISGQEEKYVLLRSYISADGGEESGITCGGIITSIRFSPATAATVSFNIAHAYSHAGAAAGIPIPMGGLKYGIYWDTDTGDRYALQESGTWVPVGSTDRPLITVVLANVDSHTVSWNINTPAYPGKLTVFIDNYYPDHPVGESFFVRLGAITAVVDSSYVPSYQRVTTVLNPDQNYTLQRDVRFGSIAARFATDGSVANGLFKGITSQNALGDVKFGNGTETYSSNVPLAVGTALQILAYHARAYSVLTGTIILEDEGNPTFREIWGYGGAKFLLQGCTWDILRGQLTGAMLREFDLFADIFPSFNVSYESALEKDSYNGESIRNSINAASSGGSSGGGGGGGTGTVTSVGINNRVIGLDITGGPITTSGEFVFTLASGCIIPQRSAVQEGQTAYGWGNHAAAGYATENWVEDQLASIDGVMLVAPKLTIVRGYTSAGSLPVDGIKIEHPMVGKTLDGETYEAVLMVYRKRNARKLVYNPSHRHIKKAYAVALGSHAITGHVAYTSTTQDPDNKPDRYYMPFSTLREFIIKRFMRDNRYTAQQLYNSMTYAAWSADTTYVNRGFRSRGGYLRLGIAIRVKNPAFTEIQRSTTISPTTTAIAWQRGGPYISRYLYSDVAPLDAILVSDNGTKNRRQMFFGVQGD